MSDKVAAAPAPSADFTTSPLSHVCVVPSSIWQFKGVHTSPGVIRQVIQHVLYNPRMVPELASAVCCPQQYVREGSRLRIDQVR